MTSEREQPPSWLQTRPADDGLTMLGRGLDDVDDAPEPNRPRVDGGDWLNPDCRDGKHAACAGDAWSEWRDRRVPCGCSCHGVDDVAVAEAYL